MNGATVKKLREGLGLNQHAFAEIIGVHVTTVYRWEAAGPAEVRIEALQARILEALERQGKLKKAEQEKRNKELKDALLGAGALFALGLLIKEITK